MKRIFIIGIILHLSMLLGAQPLITRLITYYETNPWLRGSNPAGLIFNPSVSYAIAEGSYRYTSGSLRSATEASTIHAYQILSESFRQFQKLQLYGRMNYSSISHHQRQWSATLQPENHLLNFGDTISGHQRCETYSICGKIAIPIHPHWTIGGNLDYSARSNSKNVDPRNKNTQNDILFSPGLIFNARKFHTGLNLIYQRIIEKITYTILDQQFRNARTFYPLWFYTDVDLQNGLYSSRTYQNNCYGGALQFSIKTKHYEWFNEFRYTAAIENIDIFPTQNLKAGRTNERLFSYTGSMRFNRSLHHTLQSEYRYLQRTGYDYLQGKLTQNSTTVIVEDYGRIKRSALLSYHASLSYTLSAPSDSLLNRWSLHTRLEYGHTQTIFFLYPVRFEQPVCRLNFTIDYEHNLKIQTNILSISGQLGYSSGHGSLLNLRRENNATLPEINLPQKQDLLEHDFRIATAECISISLRLQYTHPLPRKTALFFSAMAVQGVSSDSPNGSRSHLQLTTGLLF